MKEFRNNDDSGDEQEYSESVTNIMTNEIAQPHTEFLEPEEINNQEDMDTSNPNVNNSEPMDTVLNIESQPSLNSNPSSSSPMNANTLLNAESFTEARIASNNNTINSSLSVSTSSRRYENIDTSTVLNENSSLSSSLNNEEVTKKSRIRKMPGLIPIKAIHPSFRMGNPCNRSSLLRLNTTLAMISNAPNRNRISLNQSELLTGQNGTRTNPEVTRIRRYLRVNKNPPITSLSQNLRNIRNTFNHCHNRINQDALLMVLRRTDQILNTRAVYVNSSISSTPATVTTTSTISPLLTQERDPEYELSAVPLSVNTYLPTPQRLISYSPEELHALNPQSNQRISNSSTLSIISPANNFNNNSSLPVTAPMTPTNPEIIRISRFSGMRENANISSLSMFLTNSRCTLHRENQSQLFLGLARNKRINNTSIAVDETISSTTSTSTHNTEQLNINTTIGSASGSLNNYNFVSPLVTRELVTATVPEVTRTLNSEFHHFDSSSEINRYSDTAILWSSINNSLTIPQRITYNFGDLHELNPDFDQSNSNSLTSSTENISYNNSYLPETTRMTSNIPEPVRISYTRELNTNSRFRAVWQNEFDSDHLILGSNSASSESNSNSRIGYHGDWPIIEPRSSSPTGTQRLTQHIFLPLERFPPIYDRRRIEIPIRDGYSELRRLGLPQNCSLCSSVTATLPYSTSGLRELNISNFVEPLLAQGPVTTSIPENATASNAEFERFNHLSSNEIGDVPSVAVSQSFNSNINILNYLRYLSTSEELPANTNVVSSSLVIMTNNHCFKCFETRIPILKQFISSSLLQVSNSLQIPIYTFASSSSVVCTSASISHISNPLRANFVRQQLLSITSNLPDTSRDSINIDQLNHYNNPVTATSFNVNTSVSLQTPEIISSNISEITSTTNSNQHGNVYSSASLNANTSVLNLPAIVSITSTIT